MTILGYGDQISVAPSHTINFMVSCEGPKSYQADVVRIVCGDENPDGPGYKEKLIRTDVSGRYKGRKQAINAGSYAVVPAGPEFERLLSFTVQAMLWPTTPRKGEQVVIGNWRERGKHGFELMIDVNGAVALKLGSGSGRSEIHSAGKPLIEREWYFAGASYDAKSRRVTVCQEPVRRFATVKDSARATATSRLKRVGLGPGPLVMAARMLSTVKGRARTAAHYNGKIDSPRLSDRALTRAEMADVAHSPTPSHLRAAVVGAWDFSLDIPSQRIADISGNGLHGETVNLPTRAMTGHNWSGREMSWRAAPAEYGAIHFHDDDLYDCGWESDFALTVPKRMKSGSYAVRLRAGGEEDYIPFFVRPALGKPTAKIAYLAPTATYSAYANMQPAPYAPMSELLSDRLTVVQPWDQFLDAHPEFGASLYDAHSDGSGVCYSSRLRPVVNMRPKTMFGMIPGPSSVCWYNADTHLTDWLEAQSFDFDVITDEDLDRDGLALLKPYRVVLTGTHPEYTSIAMWDALNAFTEQGGRLMYLGGNGFYWRVAYSEALPGAMEVRRGEGGVRTWEAEPGEYYHAFDGGYGGLWRNQNRAPQRLAGAGFIALGLDRCSYFRRTAESFDRRVAFAFAGIGADEPIGDFGLIGGGAAGFELDIADRSLGTPPHTLVVARSEGHSDSYLLATEEHTHMPDITGTMNPDIRGDIVFFETPAGGAVFSFSSIVWCASLAHNGYDNNVSRLTANVLTRFESDVPI